MTYKLFVFILFLFSSAIFSQNSDSLFITIPLSYSNSAGKPIMINAGSLLKFEADSIYLVSSNRFNFYEKLRDKLVTLNFDCEPTIELYKNSLINNALLTKQLLENSEQTQLQSNKVISETKALLSKSEEALDLTLSNLTASKMNLEIAKRELSKTRENNILENILYSLAGIGVGIIIGVSVN